MAPRRDPLPLLRGSQAPPRGTQVLVGPDRPAGQRRRRRILAWLVASLLLHGLLALYFAARPRDMQELPPPAIEVVFEGGQPLRPLAEPPPGIEGPPAPPTPEPAIPAPPGAAPPPPPPPPQAAPANPSLPPAPPAPMLLGPALPSPVPPQPAPPQPAPPQPAPPRPASARPAPPQPAPPTLPRPPSMVAPPQAPRPPVPPPPLAQSILPGPLPMPAPPPPVQAPQTEAPRLAPSPPAPRPAEPDPEPDQAPPEPPPPAPPQPAPAQPAARQPAAPADAPARRTAPALPPGVIWAPGGVQLGSPARPSPPAGRPQARGLDLNVDPRILQGETSADSSVRVTGARVGADWRAAFRRWLDQNISYPLGALRNGESGTVRVRVVAGPDGTVRSVRLITPSGSPSLNFGTTFPFSGARLPAFPPPADPDGVTIDLTVNYILRRR